jgi:hypothetical protein
VAHAYNPRHSGDRDQEDGGLKPDPANSSPDSRSKKKKRKQTKTTLIQKRAGGVTQGVGPEFKIPVPKKKKKEFKAVSDKQRVFDIP